MVVMLVELTVALMDSKPAAQKDETMVDCWESWKVVERVDALVEMKAY